MFASKSNKINDPTTCDNRKKIREAADFEYWKNAEGMKLQYAKRSNCSVQVWRCSNITMNAQRLICADYYAMCWK